MAEQRSSCICVFITLYVSFCIGGTIFGLGCWYLISSSNMDCPYPKCKEIVNYKGTNSTQCMQQCKYFQDHILGMGAVMTSVGGALLFFITVAQILKCLCRQLSPNDYERHAPQLFEVRVHPVPPSLQTIYNLVPLEKLKTQDDCSICLESMSDNSNIVQLVGCFHNFHKKCIDQWIAHASTCPICKNDMNTIHQMQS